MVIGLLVDVGTSGLSAGLLLFVGIYVQMTISMGIISQSLSNKWIPILDAIKVILFLAVTFRMNSINLVIDLCQSTFF